MKLTQQQKQQHLDTLKAALNSLASIENYPDQFFGEESSELAIAYLSEPIANADESLRTIINGLDIAIY